MTLRNIALITVAALALGFAGRGIAQEPGLLLTNGNILTLDENDTVVDSGLVRLGRIGEGDPWGPLEKLFAEVRSMTYARAKAEDAGYGIETELAEVDGALVTAAGNARDALEAIAKRLAS